MTADVETPRSESVVTLTFELSDASVPVRAVTEMDGCRFVLETIVPRGDGRYAAYYSVDGCNPDRILALATDQDTSDADVLEHGETDGLVEVTVMDDFPPIVLAAHGAIPRRLVVADGTMTLTVDVPPKYDANGIVTVFNDVYSDGELIARRQQPYTIPVFNDRGLDQAFTDNLTDRQREALRTAFEGGFYEWPRGITGEQVAEKLEVAPPTLHQHLRAAEQKLMQLVFGEPDLRDDED